MVSEGFVTSLSLAMTRPAAMAACARARLSNRPRSTSRTSARLRGGGMDSALFERALASGSIEPLGGRADAGLERREIIPQIQRRQARRHQRALVEVERVDQHQIVGQGEIFYCQPLRID